MVKQILPITLTDKERTELDTLTRSGVASARRIRRARVLLLSADGRPDVQVAAAAGCCVTTVATLRRRFTAERLGALDEHPRPGASAKLDPVATATLIGLACTTPPPGRAIWTMQLLADQLVALGQVDAISDETVRRTLKKTPSSPGRRRTGACPS